jgi:hypothetical protein
VDRSLKQTSKRARMRMGGRVKELEAFRALPLANPPFTGTLRIKLPLFENPNHQDKRKPQPKFKFDRTEAEIRREFEGYDFHGTPFNGNWKDESDVWEDDFNVLFEIDCVFDSVRRAWLRRFKRRLKRRFKQKAIYMKVFPLVEI